MIYQGISVAKMCQNIWSGTYDSADQLEAYYKSPERAAYGEHIGSHIAKIEVREVEGVVGDVPVANK